MDIFDYIKAEETRYETVPVEVTDGWDWSMRKHIVRSKLYLNSRTMQNTDDELVYNIVMAPYNLQVRATDWDVKDVSLFAPSAKDHYKSFVATKFHEKWAKEVDLGSIANESNRSYHAYGLSLIETVQGDFGDLPQVVDLETIAFCDQTNVLAGPIGIRSYMTPAELMDMHGIWDDEAIEDAIVFSKPIQKTTKYGKDNATPGQYIKVYKVHGVLSLAYLTGEEDDKDEYVRQTHIVAEYSNEEGEKKGLTLFAGRRKKSPYNALLRDPIEGRACGRGAIEELFPEQVWTNYSMDAQKDILDQAKVMLFQTSDQRFADRNILRPTQNGQVLVHDDNKPLTQVNNSPANIVAFEQNMSLWVQNSKEKSGSFEAITGAQPKSGQPFSTTALLNQEAHGLHDQRLEDISLFWRKYYQERVLSPLQREMNKETELLSLMTRDELERIDAARAEEIGEMVEDELILSGEIVGPGTAEFVQEQVRGELGKENNERFVKIPKDYFKDVAMDVDVVIAGEHRNNALVASKLSAVFAQVVNNPAVLQDPTMAAIFNDILETSGISPLAYGLDTRKSQAAPVQQAAPEIPVEGVPSQLPAETPLTS